MLSPVAVKRSTRPSQVPGIDIVEFASEETGLVCPYFHQRFFTPDMTYFACAGEFGNKTEVVRVEVGTGNAVRLTEGGAHVHTGDLAPDGRTFYFTRDRQTLWSVDLLTGVETARYELPREDGYECTASVHLNADGSLIAVAGNREHASGVKTGRIWTIATADGTIRPVIERPFQFGHVQFSTTDPTLIMYCHETGGASPQRMWLARTTGEHPGALFTDPGHPWVTHETFTRDGKWVVFVRHPEGMGMIRPDRTGAREIDAPGAWHPGPTPDASAIVYDRHDGQLRLRRLDDGADTQISPTELGSGGPHIHPCFAPDGHTAVWTSSASGRPHPALADLSPMLT